MGNQATSVTAAITSAVLYNLQSPEVGVVELFGSFQGKSGSDPTVFRGGWFSSVSHAATGQYRVQCNLNIPTLIVAGSPSGLISEPFAWVVSETITTAPASNFYCQCTCYDVTTNVNTFDIFTMVITDAAGTLVATNVTSADRVFFRLAFKNTSVTP